MISCASPIGSIVGVDVVLVSLCGRCKSSLFRDFRCLRFGNGMPFAKGGNLVFVDRVSMGETLARLMSVISFISYRGVMPAVVMTDPRHFGEAGGEVIEIESFLMRQYG